jgi:hypothetical protein
MLHLTVVIFEITLSKETHNHFPRKSHRKKPNIIRATRETMNTIVTYEAVQTLLANPPSINPRPNFFNIRELRSHFAKALKKIPRPQSPVNGWAGAVMSPEMYALIDQNIFHLNIPPTKQHQHTPTNSIQME